MGVVPIDNTGCYVKYTFPPDMPLTSEVYIYQGYDMMTKDDGSVDLRPKLEYWIQNQALSAGNYIIFKGC